MRNCVGGFFLKVAGRPGLPVLTRSGLPRTAAFHDLNVTQRSVAARMRRATSRLVHGELLIKQRSVCGKARGSVLARRIAPDRRFAVEHGRVVRSEFSA
jgi:hypothetical protein